MLIIGCDFHAGFQVLSIFDNRSAEVAEKRLSHPGEAMAFYRGLGKSRRGGRHWRRERRVSGSGGCWPSAGMSCGWAMRRDSCGGGAARRRRTVEDAELILQLMVEERFPRIWVPTEEERDVRQLLMDRHHRMRARTAAKNQLQSLAMNQGVQKGKRLWTESGRELLSGLR